MVTPARLLRLSSLALTADEWADLVSDLAKASHILVLRGNYSSELVEAFNRRLQEKVAASGFPPTVVLSIGAHDDVEWVTPDTLILERDEGYGANDWLVAMRDTLCDLLDLSIPEVSDAVNGCIDLINRQRSA